MEFEDIKEKPEQKKYIKLLNLKRNRDDKIRSLWSVLNEISYLTGIDDFSEEDLNLWSRVTEHSAIQDRLKNKKGGSRG